MRCRTVPFTLSKLDLAFLDRHPGAVRHLPHYFRLLLANLMLFPANMTGLSADAIGVHDQGTANGPNKKVMDKLFKFSIYFMWVKATKLIMNLTIQQMEVP